uniref:Uncharacterized protein n=1 Tax=Panagrolaimus davidi TaxID=227884 RepID=A0A914PWD2_9BILA
MNLRLCRFFFLRCRNTVKLYEYCLNTAEEFGCVQFTLIDKISESNVIQLANASVTSNAKELREFCVCFLMYEGENSIVINDAKELREEITSEIGRRSLFSIVE